MALRRLALSATPEAAGAGRAGRRLARLLLAGFAAVAAITTLMPLRFAWPAGPRLSLAFVPFDCLANVILFAPLGFMYVLGRGGAPAAIARRAVVAGALLSAGIECLQVFIPGRFPSPWDLLANAGGAGAGAYAAGRLRTYLHARLVERLGLGYPLLTLVYLLTPLLWLHAGSAAADPARIVFALPLTATGAGILGIVWITRLGPLGALTAMDVAWLAAGWSIACMLPALRSPTAVIAIAAFAAAACLTIATRVRLLQADRRLEHPALRRIAPLFAVYLLGTALWPWTPDLTQDWHGGAGLPALGPLAHVTILHLLEYCAAFVVLGYGWAEYRGRHPEHALLDITRLLVMTAATAILLEVLRGWLPAAGASGARAAMAIGASACGWYLYRAQLAAVRELTAAR